MTAVFSLQKKVQISPCRGEDFLLLPAFLAKSPEARGFRQGSNSTELFVAHSSWDDQTLSLITSHLSLCFHILFLLEKKEKTLCSVR